MDHTVKQNYSNQPTKQALDFSHSLAEAAKAITSSLKLDEVLATIMQSVANLLGPENWSLLLYDEKQNDLRFEVAVGVGADKLEHMRLPLDEGIAGWVATHRQPLVVPNVAQDARFSGRMDAASNFKTGSLMCAPLVFRERLLGVIELVSQVDGQIFTEQDLAILSPFADFAAIAIENARNFRRVEELTIIDEWTCLYNPRFLQRCLQEEVERGKRYLHPVSIVFLDLDRFKLVNDTHGHSTGSALLKQAAQVILANVRNTDRPCRYGGDEFVVIMPETDKPGACGVGERIRRNLGTQEFIIKDISLKITASLGVATFPDDAADAASLLDASDRAMYAGKAQGRNVLIDARYLPSIKP